MLETFEEEIDFKSMLESQVVESHYPLHRRNTVDELSSLMSKYKLRLLWGFLTGHFAKYFEPIDLLKNYYGEKYAMEYAFLLHY